MEPQSIRSEPVQSFYQRPGESEQNLDYCSLELNVSEMPLENNIWGCAIALQSVSVCGLRNECLSLVLKKLEELPDI